MFVSFLYPFRLRGRQAPFLWVMYKQLADLGVENIHFLADGSYFVDPEIYKRAKRFECSVMHNPELRFQVPSLQNLHECEYDVIPHRIYWRIRASLKSEQRVWTHLIKEPDAELTEWLVKALRRIHNQRGVDAILTWCNYASLRSAAEILDLPVLHCELGPLRYPHYRPIGYLDFSGVNGQTEAKARWDEAPKLPRQFGSTASLRRSFSLTHSDDSARTQPSGFILGIPMQVEDDSNVLVYGNGFTLTSFLAYTLEHYPADSVLVRPHPGAAFTPSSTYYELDSSTTAASFISRCAAIATLNSSVAVEAMLFGKPTAIVGDSPAGILSTNDIRRPTIADPLKLEFLLLNYFVPYKLLFDKRYLQWRLSRPSESALRKRHVEVLFSADNSD